MSFAGQRITTPPPRNELYWTLDVGLTVGAPGTALALLREQHAWHAEKQDGATDHGLISGNGTFADPRHALLHRNTEMFGSDVKPTPRCTSCALTSVNALSLEISFFICK